jgi:hypothetical protein
MKISQDTSFVGDVINGQNGKRFALLNKREEVREDDTVQYVADGYCITGVDDVRKFLYSQVSDPLFFRMQREEVTKEEWLKSIEDIKNLVI